MKIYRYRKTKQAKNIALVSKSSLCEEIFVDDKV